MVERSLLLLLFLLWCAASFGETSAFSAGQSFSIGPGGLSITSSPGPSDSFQIKNEGNGVYSTSFSILRNLPGSAPAPTRVLPPIVIEPSSGVLTDTDTFFKGMRQTAPKSRRPIAP